jgi:hypothetical protein
MRPRLRGPYALASLVCFLNLLLFQGLGHSVGLPPRIFAGLDVTVLLAFVNVGGFVWHARRFRAVCVSEQTARPAAVDLDRGAGDVRRRR